MNSKLFSVGDLVRWKPEVLKNRYGIVVEITKSSIFVVWVATGNRDGFNLYNINEALEAIHD